MSLITHRHVDGSDATGHAARTPGPVTPSVAVVRRLGRRVVTVATPGRQAVVGRVRLVRHDDLLASTGWLPERRGSVRLRLPRAVLAGNATVVVDLADDAAGTSGPTSVRVFVPAR